MRIIADRVAKELGAVIVLGSTASELNRLRTIINARVEEVLQYVPAPRTGFDLNKHFEANKIIQLSRGYTYREQIPTMVCKDGFSFSVQVSETHYCTPRENDAVHYTRAEVGYPSGPVPTLEEFGSGDGIYGYVPIEIIEAVVDAHGGYDEKATLDAYRAKWGEKAKY